MNRRRKSGTGREGGRFIALPHSVLESEAYMQLSYPARALLLEFALQFHGDDNGRLLASRKHLLKRGWKSNATITEAKRELIEAGFLFQTVRGQRPNKASWYAVTWQTLDKLQGYDEGAAAAFERGAYRKKILCPPNGTENRLIAPFSGAETAITAPSSGAMRTSFSWPPVPFTGHPLDVPSPSTCLKTEVDVAGTRANTVMRLLVMGRPNLSGKVLAFQPLAESCNRYAYKPARLAKAA